MAGDQRDIAECAGRIGRRTGRRLPFHTFRFGDRAFGAADDANHQRSARHPPFLYGDLRMGRVHGVYRGVVSSRAAPTVDHRQCGRIGIAGRGAPEDIDYINAHGTGTHHNDLFETRAIKSAFKEDAKRVPISSTKSMIGHLLGAAGAVEFITCVKSIQDGYIHPNVGLTETEEEMNLNYVRDKGINCDVNAVISNSLGFGGHNASILIKKYIA